MQETAALLTGHCVAAHSALKRHHSVSKLAIPPALQAASKCRLKQDHSFNCHSVIHACTVSAENRLDENSCSKFQQEVATTLMGQQGFPPASLDLYDCVFPCSGLSAGEEPSNVSLQERDLAHVFVELPPHYKAAELSLNHRGSSVSGFPKSLLMRSP